MDILFYFKLNFGVPKNVREKIMRKALYIHDKMVSCYHLFEVVTTPLSRSCLQANASPSFRFQLSYSAVVWDWAWPVRHPERLPTKVCLSHTQCHSIPVPQRKTQGNRVLLLLLLWSRRSLTPSDKLAISNVCKGI